MLNGTGPDGSEWDAGSKIPAAASRTIVTLNAAGTAGIGFEWANLSTAQKTALGGSVNILNYIRGDSSLEGQNGGTYRNRSTKLGDIVDSAPVYVSSPRSVTRTTGEPVHLKRLTQPTKLRRALARLCCMSAPTMACCMASTPKQA